MSVPVIRVEPGRLADVVVEAADALKAAGFGLLTFNGNTTCFKPESGRKGGAELTDDGLALLLARAARWEGPDGQPIDPPARVVGAVRAELTIRCVTFCASSRAEREDITATRAPSAQQLVFDCMEKIKELSDSASLLRQYARENPGDPEAEANVKAAERAVKIANARHREACEAVAAAEAQAVWRRTRSAAEAVAEYLAEQGEAQR